MKVIDDILNNITMYRLILYYLIALLVVASVLSFFGVLSYSIFSIIFSVAFLVIVSLITNNIFAKVFKAVTNIESVYISALILALVITPANSLSSFVFLFWAAVLAMASKYILAINKKHLFNPVAISIALTALTTNQSASWWIGTASMMPYVLIGGLLIVRKIKKEDLIIVFLLVATTTVLVFSFLNKINLLSVSQKIILDSPLLFLAFVMLTEPLTTPPTKKLQMLYGALVGFLFVPQIHFGSIYSTPELSLLVGNAFSYLVSPKQKLILKLKEKIKIAPDIYDFVFGLNQKLVFSPGQYLEWTLDPSNSDSRGNRRYFTIASSPTENNIRIGVKFNTNSSSFKKSLISMDQGSEIVASQLAGDFTLPKDINQKLVFIAGGIGITPFRSMVKYLLDINQRRSIIVFYSNRTSAEIVYTDIFNEVTQQLGIKTIYTLTDRTQIPVGWQGRVGYIDEQIIKKEVPDYTERLFYLSGSHLMVTAFEEVLEKMGVKKKQIIIDYFPGFA